MSERHEPPPLPSPVHNSAPLFLAGHLLGRSHCIGGLDQPARAGQAFFNHPGSFVIRAVQDKTISPRGRELHCNYPGAPLCSSSAVRQLQCKFRPPRMPIAAGPPDSCTRTRLKAFAPVELAKKRFHAGHQMFDARVRESTWFTAASSVWEAIQAEILAGPQEEEAEGEQAKPLRRSSDCSLVQGKPAGEGSSSRAHSSGITRTSPIQQASLVGAAPAGAGPEHNPTVPPARRQLHIRAQAPVHQQAQLHHPAAGRRRLPLLSRLHHGLPAGRLPAALLRPARLVRAR